MPGEETGRAVPPDQFHLPPLNFDRSPRSDRHPHLPDLPGADDPYARSADVLVDISADSPPSIAIPRRGDGYEITYPSGNECWIDAAGTRHCAITRS